MKRLGQHFLKSKKIVQTVIKAAEIKKTDVVLEVGPGRGIFTGFLLEKAGKIIAVEKDKNLVELLQRKFSNQQNLAIIQDDILKIKNSALFKKLKLKIKNFKVVANIPYYITSRFLRQFLESKNQPMLMVLILQKEVAQRIVAQPPNMNLLALSVQAYARPCIIARVSKKYFSPQPKVDSAIVKIQDISKNFFLKNKIEEKKFFTLLKRGFSHKRKLLKNNLKISDDILKKSGLDKKSRAQELSLKDWTRLIKSTPDD